MSTLQRIEKDLDRLRQRYGVSNGLTIEPKIIAICNGPKATFSVTSLKAFYDNLNTLEVFAYAHDEIKNYRANCCSIPPVVFQCVKATFS